MIQPLPTWVLIGGTGQEENLWKLLGHPPMTVIGTQFVLDEERFAPAPWAQSCFPEHLSPNYAALISEAKGIIHLSSNLLSCHLAMNMALVYHTPAWIFVPSSPWRLFFFPGNESNGCLDCIEVYASPAPGLLLEDLSESWLHTLASLWHDPPQTSFLWETPKNGSPVRISEVCPLHHGQHPYLKGRCQIIVAVSCGENSVAISPSFEKTIDLSSYAHTIKPFATIRKKNDFFIELEYKHFTCLIFRQGRFIVKGTKEKNTALSLYHLLIGV